MYTPSLWRDHSGSSASFWVWLSVGTCELVSGLFFCFWAAGSRSESDLDLLSIVNHLLGLSSSLEGILLGFSRGRVSQDISCVHACVFYVLLLDLAYDSVIC